jgi:hypothetical protein
VQDRSLLGGNASSEVKMHIVGADCHGAKPGRRESGLIEELKLEDAARNPHRSYSQWDLLLYEKVKLEPNITLLLDADLVAAETVTLADGRREIRSARIVRNLMEEDYTVHAKFFADCTGDGRLGAEAGADFQIGREARDEFGESLAQPVADKHTLGSSILITGRRYDTPQHFASPSWSRRFKKSDFKHRPIHSFEYGYWWFEWGGQIDSIKDNEVIRHELLRIALGVWDYIKNSGDYPEAAHWALDWVGSIPAKRESRRFKGPHVLTQGDVQGATVFADQVAYGGWAIDLHPLSGVDVPDQPPFTPFHVHPALLDSAALLSLAQRLQSLFRRSQHQRDPRRVCQHARDGDLRAWGPGHRHGRRALAQRLDRRHHGAVHAGQRLRAPAGAPGDDAYLLNLPGNDSADLARTAKITARSASPEASPELVPDGITRDLRADFAPWSSNLLHHWESTALPATLSLALAAPAALREIHLTFDSGFQRELVLTPSDHITKKIVRGPQPETVKHYRIKIDGSVVVEETANYHRKRIHRLSAPVTGARVEIEVVATHGVPTARVFEVRLYS